ncbi:uncharacterized protein ACA1_310500 [Acanthamoeba castellanii str. Neff]|uniref:Uncharacterized protein n=1 Tax=Acanthamoeba castellanii (strain ATCC 30010 / Neff) TaxID=1257118 RepID=L8GYI4_ACACF|nr:uncharacterized protein ACA1_310500 [Acanthamoeba castellanii str. Neff]ELR18349.1 hypothetical protein ACA1_310500 [Acanthamoeba castellanii str. Neff]
MDEVYDEFLGSKQLRFFHPDVSRRTVLEVEREQRLDLGFKVIQVLDEAIALGRQLGLLKGPDTPQAEPTTTSPSSSSAEAQSTMRPDDPSSSETVPEAAPPRLRPYARAASLADVRPGMLLVPHPLLLDPFWQHTVILVLSHSPLTGASGAVINRPESRLFMRTKRPADDKEPEKKYFKAFYGGPVGLSELYWLSKAEPTSLPPAEEVYPGLYHGRSMALFDWNREADAAVGDEAAATTKRRGKGEKKEKTKEKTKMKGEEEKVSEAKGEGGAARMRPPLFSATSMPPGSVVDVADRDKQSQMWADVLRDMGGRYAPLAKFALPTLPPGGGDEEDQESLHGDEGDDEDEDDER